MILQHNQPGNILTDYFNNTTLCLMEKSNRFLLASRCTECKHWVGHTRDTTTACSKTCQFYFAGFFFSLPPSYMVTNVLKEEVLRLAIQDSNYNRQGRIVPRSNSSFHFHVAIFFSIEILVNAKLSSEMTKPSGTNKTEG